MDAGEQDEEEHAVGEGVQGAALGPARGHIQLFSNRHLISNCSCVRDRHSFYKLNVGAGALDFSEKTIAFRDAYNTSMLDCLMETENFGAFFAWRATRPTCIH